MSEPVRNTSNAGPERQLPGTLLWLVVSVIVAGVVGQLFEFVPTRFRLLGLLAIGQGCVAGLLLGRAAIPLKMNYQAIGAAGGFVAGAASVAITGVLLWLGWASQIKLQEPRPDTALAAQMLAQMKEPTDGDAEQLKAYEETRRQMSEFIAQQSAPPEVEFTDWLTHRTSVVTDDRRVAILIGLIELLLAGAAAGWLARSIISRPFCSTCQTWRQVVRSHTFTSPISESLLLMLSDSDRQTVSAVSVEFSTCECDARPTVHLKMGTANGRLRDVPDTASLSDEQFASLKRLLDEAQGMG